MKELITNTMKSLGSLTFIVMVLMAQKVSGQVFPGVDREKRRTVTYGIVHYAGSIGFLSAGIGLMNNRQTRSAEFLIGYLPKGIGANEIITLNWKAGIATKAYPLGNNLSLQPLNLNIVLSYSPVCDYDVTRPAVFPEGYYWWSEAIRVNLNVGTTLLVNRTFSVYYELGTNELKLISYVLNTNSLAIQDIMHLGAGVRFRIN